MTITYDLSRDPAIGSKPPLPEQILALMTPRRNTFIALVGDCTGCSVRNLRVPPLKYRTEFGASIALYSGRKSPTFEAQAKKLGYTYALWDTHDVHSMLNAPFVPRYFVLSSDGSIKWKQHSPNEVPK